MNRAGRTEPYIVCMIADSSYAIEASSVQQLELIESIARVPGTRDSIDGVVYLRGQVIPVINLRCRLGLPRIPFDLSARLVIVRHGARVVALAVDSAREFLTFPLTALQPPPETLLGFDSGHLAGVIALAERLIFILDIPRLLEGEQPALKGDTHGSSQETAPVSPSPPPTRDS